MVWASHKGIIRTARHDVVSCAGSGMGAASASAQASATAKATAQTIANAVAQATDNNAQVRLHAVSVTTLWHRALQLMALPALPTYCQATACQMSS